MEDPLDLHRKGILAVNKCQILVPKKLSKMASKQNIQHVSEFSTDGKLYAFLDSEGKLKIWDTNVGELKQDYTPNLHLNAPCTCFTWITGHLNTKVAKRARKSLDHVDSSLYIALGTSKGGVSLYSYATQNIEQIFKGNGHNGSVTSICRGSSDILYTCGEDCHVIVWSISQGKQTDSWIIGADVPTCIMYLPESKNLLVGSRDIKLWDAETHDLKQTYTGHSSNVVLLKSLQIGSIEYALSASRMDRTICLWRIKTGSKHKNAAGTFLMADIALTISCEIDPNNSVQIAAVTKNGVAHIFIIDDNPTFPSAKPIKPKVTIEVASDADKAVIPVPIVTAKLGVANKNQTILLGYGSRQLLRFEYLEYSTAERNQVIIRNDPEKPTAKHTAYDKLKTITPIVNESVEYQTPTALIRKTKAIEIPMETRLENLSLSSSETPFSKNVAQLLIQGLHSHDANMLRTAFSNVDEKVIRVTLQRLPTQYVRSLINELTILALKKTSNVQMALAWLKILLQTHASQLMALGTNELFERFGPLIGVIEHRANTCKPLSKISGRLDLLASQIKRNTNDDAIENENVLMFEDLDTPESSDVEDGNQSSDNQWDGDNSENDENMDMSENDE